MGPLLNAKQYDRVLGYYKHGLETEKLKLAYGGGKAPGFSKGYFVQPSIFTHVPEDSKLAKEEIFGPVLAVMKPFSDFKDVIEKANDTVYGLSSAIFTSDMNKSEYFVRKSKAGVIYVNEYGRSPYNVPFGGMKQSGFGRDNGEEALHEYTTVKAIYNKFEFNFLKK